MKKHLLVQKNAYKANMHMHTTVSDGRMTPEETKQAYLDAGYSIVAFTDHEVIAPQNHLRDEHFLPITSYEVAVNESQPGKAYEHIRTYHINLFSKDPEQTFSSAFSASHVMTRSKAFVPHGMEKLECPKEYSVDCINSIIEKARKEGFLVSYNHPVWSLQSYPDYAGLKGLWGVELHNTGCVHHGYVDTPQPLEDLLRAGERVFPLATDDAHSLQDCFGGWIWVLADRLEYADVMEALEKGDFYASTGPEIREISLDEGILTVRTSSAVTVDVATDRRVYMRRGDGKNEITEASFDLTGWMERNPDALHAPYFRVTVQDASGAHAWSRAYFLDELA